MTRWPSELSVRPEAAHDATAIRRVHEDAFGGPLEAQLVDELRRSGALTVSLVAERAGVVVGHVALSPVSVPESPAAPLGLGLAPIGVLTAQQRGGVGSALMRAALGRARSSGASFVVLLGDPGYYSRFGFRDAAELGLRCAYDAPAGAFQALELSPDSLRSSRGLVRYHRAFDAFD